MPDSSQSSRSTDDNARALTGAAHKCLVFRVGQEEHAVELLSVREVSSQRPVRPIPGAPRQVIGVMNLRGHVISVVSLAALIGEAAPDCDGPSAMLIVDLPSTTLAVLVDEVVAVRSIAPEEIDKGSHPELPISSKYISGIAHVGERLVTILDLPGLLAAEILTKAA